MIVYVNVKPHSNEESIEKVGDIEYNVSVREVAEDNRANNRVVNLLAKEFGVNYRKIKIKNPKSRKKIVEIESIKI